MTLTVAPLTTHDALVSLATADAYHLAMGNAGWSALDAVKEAAIRRATQYLEAHYRINPLYLDPVHVRIAQATSEAALRQLTGALYQDVDARAIKSEKVDVLETVYADPVNGGQTRFALIDELMRDMTLGGFGQVFLVRA